MTETSLVKSLPKVLDAYYEKKDIIATNDFIYVKGDIPIALVAHLDTVHRQVVRVLYHDEKKGVLWSPQGLGADDRAGVFAILKILEAGYRPSVIFCTQEESGGTGAREFIKKFNRPAVKTNFLIELDRRGINDSVYYDFDNPLFEEYINNYGFVTDWGSFTDISIISPHWRLPAVNLSTGYLNEHTLSETLHYCSLYQTIEKVKRILDAEMTVDHIFEYKEINYDNDFFFRRFGSFWGNSNNSGSMLACDLCGFTYSKSAMTPVVEHNCTFNICPDCVRDNISWCAKCGRGYLGFFEDDPDAVSGLCSECKGEH